MGFYNNKRILPGKSKLPDIPRSPMPRDFVPGSFLELWALRPECVPTLKTLKYLDFENRFIGLQIKGKVRTINDRNICERRSCMKNNGKIPTFKFVLRKERRPSEVQRVSRGWHLPGTTHSSADLTWIRKWLEIQAPDLSELESVELELGSCCSDLAKQVLDEICRTRKRQLEIPLRL